MSSDEMGSLVLTLSIFIASVHVLGYIFERLWQPRLVGEILAGALLGPSVLGHFAPSLSATIFGNSSVGVGKTEVVLNFIYWIGLFLLMFISGSETRRLMAKENQRATAWLVGVGTPLPFLLVLGLGLGAFLPLHLIVGKAGQTTSALLVLAIAVAVTSIPVISRIFHDLKILHTRFASLILGSAVLEDIILWGVLAIATSIASSAWLAQQYIINDMTAHITATFAYMVVGLTVAPRILKQAHHTRWNLLVKASPVGYLFVILFIYAAVASMLGVNLVFASFLAGFGLVGGVAGSERARFSDSLESIARVSFGIFIPIYFAVVGHKLAFGRDFSLPMLMVFLSLSSLLALLSVGLAAKLAGFRKLDIVNLAITTNARGGPGIVLASVAFDAGIINAQFYTTLVLTAVITSQAAGAWLKFVLSRGWPLLSSNPTEGWYKAELKFPPKLEGPQKNVA
jgi:Kef-type K+ transport system membrane component KefB